MDSDGLATDLKRKKSSRTRHGLATDPSRTQKVQSHALRTDFESVDPLRTRYGFKKKVLQENFFEHSTDPSRTLDGLLPTSTDSSRTRDGPTTDPPRTGAILAPQSVKGVRGESVTSPSMHVTGT